MRLVDAATGVVVDDAEFGTHLFKWLAAEDGDRFDRWRTIQPSSSVWSVVSGTVVLDYSVALRWACTIAIFHPETFDMTIVKRDFSPPPQSLDA